MIPGRSNLLRIQADQPGVYGGQCAEYCGGPHALMGFVGRGARRRQFAQLMRGRLGTGRGAAAPPATRARRATVRSRPAAPPATASPARGATASPGPTSPMSAARLTLGAGILPNNRGTLIGWIGDSQAIKPGNRMPAYTVSPASELKRARRLPRGAAVTSETGFDPGSTTASRPTGRGRRASWRSWKRIWACARRAGRG